MDNKVLKNVASLVKPDRPARPDRAPVYLKLDTGTLKWFKAQGRGYQKLIEDVLTAYMKEVTAHTERLANAQELYRRYYARCFWHLRPDLKIDESNIDLVIEGLRRHGGRAGFIEAEALCH